MEESYFFLINQTTIFIFFSYQPNHQQTTNIHQSMTGGAQHLGVSGTLHQKRNLQRSCWLLLLEKAGPKATIASIELKKNMITGSVAFC